MTLILLKQYNFSVILCKNSIISLKRVLEVLLSDFCAKLIFGKVRMSKY